MFRLFLLLLIISLLAIIIWRFKNYFTRENKVDELEAVRLESDLINIDKEIAEEKVRQQEVSSEIEELNSQANINKEENSNG